MAYVIGVKELGKIIIGTRTGSHRRFAIPAGIFRDLLRCICLFPGTGLYSSMPVWTVTGRTVRSQFHDRSV